MNKKLFILSSMLLVGIYANSMQLTEEELKSFLKKNDPHNHNHTLNNENCEKKCIHKKIKILQKIKEMNELIRQRKIDQKLGKKQIKEMINYWNQEHPENQI